MFFSPVSKILKIRRNNLLSTLIENISCMIRKSVCLFLLLKRLRYDRLVFTKFFETNIDVSLWWWSFLEIMENSYCNKRKCNRHRMFRKLILVKIRLTNFYIFRILITFISHRNITLFTRRKKNDHFLWK